VLEGGPGTRTHLEVALLPDESPHDLAAVALYLVYGPGISGTEEQVAVGLYVYGVDVEVVVDVVGSLPCSSRRGRRHRRLAL
jgi:hypothetical protein